MQVIGQFAATDMLIIELYQWFMDFELMNALGIMYP
jgi:hypothetical protein